MNLVKPHFSHSYFFIPWAVFSVLLLAIVLHIPSLVNPGFFNHDELQIADFIRHNGFFNYVEHYVSIPANAPFGSPIRPVAFFIQGLIALSIDTHPWLTHFLDLIIHLFNCIALFFFLKLIGLNQRASLIAVFLFSISPLTIYSTAWSGAIHDRLFTFFLLIQLTVAIVISKQEKWSFFFVILLLVSSTAAMLSKETALMSPIAVAGAVIFFQWLQGDVKWNRAILVVSLASLPVLVFLGFRIFALLQLMTNTVTTDAYRPEIANVARNISLYLAYPFFPALGELVSYIFFSKASLLAAGLAHLFLIAIVIRVWGWIAGAIYVISYFLFLLPVISISSLGGHYMYASALSLSVVLGMIVHHFLEKNNWLLLVFFILPAILALTLHFFSNQLQILKLGQCQARITTSLRAIRLAEKQREKHSSEILFIPDPDAPSYVLGRFFTGRTAFGEETGMRFHVASEPAPTDIMNQSVYRLSRDCLIYEGHISSNVKKETGVDRGTLETD